VIRINGEPRRIESHAALIDAVDEICAEADLPQYQIEDALKENVERAQRGEAGSTVRSSKPLIDMAVVGRELTSFLAKDNVQIHIDGEKVEPEDANWSDLL